MPLRRAQYVSRLTCWLLIFCHGHAWGHAGAVVESIDIVRPVESGRLGVETTIGYLRSDDGDNFEWLCHEAVTEPGAIITPQYTENGAGMVLGSVGDLTQARQASEALYWSADGCDWTPAEGLTGHEVADVQLSPTDNVTAMAVASSADGLSGIYRSADAGRSWSPVGVSSADKRFRSVKFSRGLAGSVWATAVRFETSQAWVYRSVDAGLTWSEHELVIPLDDDVDVFLDVLTPDADDPDTAWFVQGPFLDDVLIKTSDGGETFTEEYALDGDIIDGAQDPSGGLWLVLSGNHIVYAPEDGFFTEVESAPMSLGVESDSSAVMLATRVPIAGSPLAISTGGAAFESTDVFQQLQPLSECPDESDYGMLCAPLWAEIAEGFVSPIEDTGGGEDTDSADPITTTSASTSGCCKGEAKQAHAGLLVLVLFGISRRRH